MRLDSSGNLLVGKTVSDLTTDGFEVRPTGFVGVRSNGDPLYLNRKSSDGAIATFAKDGTTVGSIGTDSGGNLQTLSSTGNYRFGDSDTTRWSVDVTRMYPMLDATYDIGLSSNRVRDLYLSGSAKLVADSAASAEIQLKQTGTGGRDYRISSTGSGYGSAGALIFYDATASSERARFDASGNLLVGTTVSPTATVTSHGYVSLSSAKQEGSNAKIITTTTQNITRQSGIGGMAVVTYYNLSGGAQQTDMVLWSSTGASVASTTGTSGLTATYGINTGALTMVLASGSAEAVVFAITA